MPSSSALRYSPERGQRIETHKRGRSMEDAFFVKDKDEDLELFNDLQLKERENFLLQSTDDFDSSFSMKLKHLSDIKLGTSAHCENSELLNVDGEKNDYDWLLTPPDTPLFPSLDDDTLSISVATRGRPRSQPIAISRSSTIEKSYRNKRGSPSPNRVSRSPCSVTSSTSRGRPSSSPTSSQRSVTPSFRSSPPPSKGLVCASRSSTSNSRRMSTGSSNHGSSPVRTSRGNSPSQKIRTWQSNFSGFSCEAPPNLRTSSADRPASYVRGSSPVLRNNRRKSTSPTASRYIQDLDDINSPSRGSLNLGGHVNLQSGQSYNLGNTDRLRSKRVGAIQSNRSPSFSKKPTKVFSPSSTPKKSFEAVLQQMEHRKKQSKMFRPLLSSAPSGTFHVGKEPSASQSLILQNYSPPSRSNTSLDHGHAVVLNEEEKGDIPEIVTSHGSNVPEEELAYPAMDAMNEATIHSVQLNGSEHGVRDNIDKDEISVSSESLQHSIDGKFRGENLGAGAEVSQICTLEDMNVCMRCGSRYLAVSSNECEISLCLNCIQEEDLFTMITEKGEPLSNGDSLVQTTGISSPSELYEHQHTLSTCDRNVNDIGTLLDEQGSILSLENPCLGSSLGGCQGKVQFPVSHDSDADAARSVDAIGSRMSMVGLSETVGVSALLKKSNSCKAHVFRERLFSASTVTYDDLFRARDSVRRLRSSVVNVGTSPSSSIDFSSARLGEAHLPRKLSLKKSNTEVNKIESHARSQSCSSVLNQHIQMGESPSWVNDKHIEELIECNIKLRASEEHGDASGSWAANGSNLNSKSCEEFNSSDASGCQLADLQNKLMASVLHGDRVATVGNVNLVNCLNDQTNLRSDMPNVLPNCSNSVLTHVSASGVELDNCGRSERGSENENSGRVNAISAILPDYEELSAEVKSSHDITNLSEESVVVLSNCGESNPRNLTLEEATDRILFCSSLVNDMVYHAATIASEKESSMQLEVSKPTVTVLRRSNGSKNEPRGDINMTSKLHKVKQKQANAYNRAPSAEAENDENKNETMVRNVEIKNKAEGSKPPKLESKCNCRIM